MRSWDVTRKSSVPHTFGYCCKSNMETLKMVVRISLICTGLIKRSCAVCGGIVNSTSGSIQSPKLVANCTWLFENVDSRQALKLKLTNMKMYYYDVNGDVECRDSHRLVINGVPVDCKISIINGSEAKYFSFYSDQSCSNVDDCSQGCDDWIKLNSSTVNVEYFADGSRPTNAEPSELWGFEMTYEYSNCSSGSLPSSEDCEQIINSSSGIIPSPSYWSKNGKASNCTWQFDGIDSRRGLNISLIFMDMYIHDDNSDNKCNDSYRLLINEENMDCSQRITPQQPKHFFFYNDPSCEVNECINACVMRKINSSSIKVKFFAHGSSTADTVSGETRGFQITYKYTECMQLEIHELIILVTLLSFPFLITFGVFLAMMRRYNQCPSLKIRRQSIQNHLEQCQNETVRDGSTANAQANIIPLVSLTDSRQKNDSNGIALSNISASKGDYVMRPLQYPHDVG